MTKKPSEKNKAWEKERRDRLNKTFDELAKLLPKYDPSVVWSKIEIIQKAIALISDLQKKLSDYLESKDPEKFKTYEDFVDCLKFYQQRNAQLTDLLKGAKVTLPPVVLPQLLVDKPELLPKDDNPAVIVQKPKRQRNRSKKTEQAQKSTEDEKNKDENEPPNAPESTSNDAIKDPVEAISVPAVEVVTKPTAIITAFTRQIPIDVPVAVEPPPPPLAPTKPLFLRLRKPNSIRRLKLIPKPMFRKCYPHPDRMFRWNLDRPSHLKLCPRARQNRTKPLRKLKSTHRHVEAIREQSVSPTAAFLLSFPVVTSTMVNGKNVENVESAVSLENLNNFFTTEEYSKFCDQNPVAEDKVLMPICTPSPAQIGGKPIISGKPMTAFTVSAITRPNSPKKPMVHCEQVISKRANETPWIVENKCLRSGAPATSLDGCYNFTNTNSIIGSTSQQTTLTQYSPATAVPLARFSTPVAAAQHTSLKSDATSHTVGLNNLNSTPVAAAQHTSLKSDATSHTVGLNNLNSTGQFFPRYNHSILSASTLAINSVKTTMTPTIAVKTQKGAVPLTWTTKSPTSSGKTSKTQATTDLCNMKNTEPRKSDAKVKSNSKSANSFYSVTKSWSDFPTQSQTITTPSSADPLISSTTVTRSHSFLGFPSIKAEFPWLSSNTTMASAAIPTTTTAITPGTCNLTTNLTPFDLASIVCESLTSTSFTFSLTTPKSSEPTVIEAGNKPNTTNKCNQINIFHPYDEVQYMKSADSQIPWKPDKAKDISDHIFYDCEQSKAQQKSHVNWMTSPTTDYTPAPAALPLPPIDFGNQYPASTNFDYNFGCRKDSYDDDNQFINWSPTKPLNADFSTAYSFENFGSNEAPPNKTVKQIFSVSQLVDQDTSPMKKTKSSTQKSTPMKQTFSNIYSAESLIAKKETNVAAYCNTNTSNTQPDYHNTSSYFYNYPNSQNCLDNDYLSASGYSGSAPSAKTTSILPSTGGSLFDQTAVSSTSNYFSHTISSSANDPYDPTYFPSSNYNHPTANWNKGPHVNSYGHSQLPLGGVYAATEPSCQQNSTVSGNLTNFNLSSICPEIDGKDEPNGW